MRTREPRNLLPGSMTTFIHPMEFLSVGDVIILFILRRQSLMPVVVGLLLILVLPMQLKERSTPTELGLKLHVQNVAPTWAMCLMEKVLPQKILATA